MVTDAYELKRLKEDAHLAMDALAAIADNIVRDNCIHEHYLKEKADRAYACCKFLMSEAKALADAAEDDGK